MQNAPGVSHHHRQRWFTLTSEVNKSPDTATDAEARELVISGLRHSIPTPLGMQARELAGLATFSQAFEIMSDYDARLRANQIINIQGWPEMRIHSITSYARRTGTTPAIDRMILEDTS